MNHFLRFQHIATICLIGFMSQMLHSCTAEESENTKPRIIVSTDIGGTDPDDFQSMIHLLMYSESFDIEGLISSPFGPGRRQDIIDMIDLYEKDLPKLREHRKDLPHAEDLRNIARQGAIGEAPYKGYSSTSEGSDWIVECARRPDDRPLWILVWGGIEDLAQALHDAPDIKEKIRVYWIGGPNKKWSVNAYAYIAEHHPDLWMIEANATYRGWFLDDDAPEEISNAAFFEEHIRDRGAMGRAFINYYMGHIKMGDTPSLAYLMNGDPDDPEGESWGGSFTQIAHSSRHIFKGNSSVGDTVIAYGVIEWEFPGPELDIPSDSACFSLEISGQVWPGYYAGDGVYRVRYSSKKPEICDYLTRSSIPELDGQIGQFVSIAPWPGRAAEDDYQLGDNWYTDRPEPELFFGIQQGARTVSKHREAFLGDWALRWQWLGEE